MDKPRKDYSKFDSMSTEKLEEILRADFEASCGKESDIDMILYIMGVIAKRKQEKTIRAYADAEQAWKSFHKNYCSDCDRKVEAD